jgi:hypothetical protein
VPELLLDFNYWKVEGSLRRFIAAWVLCGAPKARKSKGLIAGYSSYAHALSLAKNISLRWDPSWSQFIGMNNLSLSAPLRHACTTNRSLLPASAHFPVPISKLGYFPTHTLTLIFRAGKIDTINYGEKRWKIFLISLAMARLLLRGYACAFIIDGWWWKGESCLSKKML